MNEALAIMEKGRTFTEYIDGEEKKTVFIFYKANKNVKKMGTLYSCESGSSMMPKRINLQKLTDIFKGSSKFPDPAKITSDQHLCFSLITH